MSAFDKIRSAITRRAEQMHERNHAKWAAGMRAQGWTEVPTDNGPKRVPVNELPAWATSDGAWGTPGKTAHLPEVPLVNGEPNYEDEDAAALTDRILAERERLTGLPESEWTRGVSVPVDQAESDQIWADIREKQHADALAEDFARAEAAVEAMKPKKIELGEGRSLEDLMAEVRANQEARAEWTARLTARYPRHGGGGAPKKASPRTDSGAFEHYYGTTNGSGASYGM